MEIMFNQEFEIQWRDWQPASRRRVKLSKPVKRTEKAVGLKMWIRVPRPDGGWGDWQEVEKMVWIPKSQIEGGDCNDLGMVIADWLGEKLFPNYKEVE